MKFLGTCVPQKCAYLPRTRGQPAGVQSPMPHTCPVPWQPPTMHLPHVIVVSHTSSLSPMLSMCYSSFDLSSIYEVISDLSRRVR